MPPSVKQMTGQGGLDSDEVTLALDALAEAHHLVLGDDHTCGRQRIFCSTECVERWLARTGNERGYVMSLTVLWRFAAHWYDGRLDRGYLRRDPAHAAEYLRGVGLTGPFGGVDRKLVEMHIIWS